MHISKYLLIAASLAILSSCSPNNKYNTEFPVDSVFSSLYSDGFNQRLIGSMPTSYGQPVLMELTSSITPLSDTQFENQKVKSSEVNVEIYTDGILANKTINTYYFNTKPFKLIGFKGDGVYSIVKKHGNVPATATVGSEGLIAEEVNYSIEDKNIVLSNSTYEWSLTSAGEKAAYLCNNAVIDFVDDSIEDTSFSDCVKINVDGTIIGSMLNLPAPNGQGILSLIDDGENLKQD